MQTNKVDGNLIVPDTGTIGFGFPADNDTESTGPRFGGSQGNPNGSVEAPLGSLIIDSDSGAWYKNINGGTGWVQATNSTTSGRFTLLKQWELSLEDTGAQAYGDDPAFELAGTGTPNANPSANGGIGIATSASASDTAIAQPSASNANSYAITDWDGDEALVKEGWVVPTSVVTDCEIEVGVRGTPSAFDTGTNDNKMILRYDSAVSPNWQFVASDSGTDDVWDTGVAVVEDNLYTFTMLAEPGTRVARLWLNGTEVSNPAEPTVGAADLGFPYGGVKTTTTAARSIDYGNFLISRDI